MPHPIYLLAEIVLVFLLFYGTGKFWEWSVEADNTFYTALALTGMVLWILFVFALMVFFYSLALSA